MKLRIASIIVLLSILAGCATEAAFRRNMDMWIGHGIEDFIQVNGPPTHPTVETDTRRMYFFARSENWSYTTPATAQTTVHDWGTGVVTAETQVYGGQTYSGTNHCTTTVYTAKNNVIVAWSAQGNYCVAY